MRMFLKRRLKNIDRLLIFFKLMSISLINLSLPKMCLILRWMKKQETSRARQEKLWDRILVQKNLVIVQ